MKIKQLITEALRLPTNAFFYHISQGLAAMYPDKVLLEGSDDSFQLQHYAYAKLCDLQCDSYIYNQIITGWYSRENRIYKYAKNAMYEVVWQAEKLNVLLMSWQEGSCNICYYWILADSKELAEKFFTAVCDWNAEICDEILVFEHGRWDKNSDLFRCIQDSSFENLILHSNVKEDILGNLTDFFTSCEVCADFGVPWKRGILFIGSPGNGKTHTVKALINQLRKPCLYVKSFKSHYGIDSISIRQVFEQARESAPCILVLEDIDSLLTDENRSFFLNELDGFANNQGIMTIATTNHLERLDPAIRERPSRFDRKFHFELPGIGERKTFLTFWNDNKFKPEMRLSNEAVDQIVALTEGFSFAYLKELVYSSMIPWMKEKKTGMMEQIMLSQVTILREEMSD
ncbi:ATP-binding protein [Nostoc sp.]|uniref:ATP-binding protein n=1 Tax=Nostoc sp. TaxID=1180 RepID=UPI002FFBC8C2